MCLLAIRQNPLRLIEIDSAVRALLAYAVYYRALFTVDRSLFW